MKAIIAWDEWYPVYSVVDARGVEVDATEADVDRWKYAAAQFERAQKEMAALVKEKRAT